MKKQIVYVDMDGVLVDLAQRIQAFKTNGLLGQLGQANDFEVDEVPGLFKDPFPIKGAIEGYKRLCKKYDVYILSTAPWGNVSAWSDKRLWVEKWLGDVAFKRLILSHNKNLCKGDYLIDDRTKNGAGEFEGELIQFGNDKYPNWDSVLKYLKA
jgi:5'(3')-deoxyribonucleotidase